MVPPSVRATALDPPRDRALRLALSYAPPRLRAPFAVVFALDELLRHGIRQPGEAILAQMRLAWWRDALARPSSALAGQPLLRAVRTVFQGEAAALVPLVDAREAFLDIDRDPAELVTELAAARAASLAAIARLGDLANHTDAASQAGRLWAWADLAAGWHGPRLIAAALDSARRAPVSAPVLPPLLRPAAVIAGLSRRALRRGGGPLLGDRLSPLAAMRLGIFGC